MTVSISKWWTALAVVAVMVAPAGRAHAQPYAYALGTAPLDLDQELTVIDAATNRLVAKVRLGATQGTRPEHMVMAPDGARIYVINNLDFNAGGRNAVSVVSTRTHTLEDTWPQSLVGNSPQAMALSPDSRRLYVTSLDVVNGTLRGSLVVVDVVSKSRLATIPFGLKKAYGVVASPDGSRLYLLTQQSGMSVTVLDATSYGVVAETTLPGTAFGTTIALSPDGRFAYVPRQPNGSQLPGIVNVFDTSINTVVATASVTNNPRSVAVSPDGATVYVATPTLNGGLLHRLDPATHATLGATNVVSPIAVAFRADSSRAYVAALDKVYVVDTTTHAVIATIPVPSRVLNSGAGNSIAAIVATPPPNSPPGSTPTTLRAAIAGNSVTLTWSAPTSVSPTAYVVEGGVTPQQVSASIPTGSTATAITLDVPTGTFYVRVRAVTAAGLSGASNEIRIAVNLPLPPTAPAGLRGLANGSDLALSWTIPSSGGQPASLVLDVSGAISTSLTLPVSESFTFSGVPTGTYTIAVRAINGTGASAPSAPVTLAFPGTCPGVPDAPANFTVARQGSQLTVAWEPPTGGEAVTSYVLTVTGALNLALPVSGRSLSGNVPPGAYQLAIRAVNPCGSGADAPVQTVTVP